MADLEIPDRAVEVAWREYALGTFDVDQIDESHIAATMKAAAPIIVAAELRRLAAELYDGPQRWPASKVGLLRDRADQLDPPGDNQ